MNLKTSLRYVILAGLFQLVFLTAIYPVSKPPISDGRIKYVPQLTYKTLQGTKLTPQMYKNKVMLVTFWATWCGPCVSEVPHLISLDKKYRKKGLVILGLSLDQRASTVHSFIETHKIKYPITMVTDKIEHKFGSIHAIPTTFIVNRKGHILYKLMGYETEASLEKILTPLLDEQLRE